jgi:hypothetical protein
LSFLDKASIEMCHEAALQYTRTCKYILSEEERYSLRKGRREQQILLELMDSNDLQPQPDYADYSWETLSPSFGGERESFIPN